MNIRRVVAIIVPRDDDEILISRRIGTSYSGLYSCPGGKIEPGETALEAAIRELREETGLSGTLRQFPNPVIWTNGDTEYNVTYFLLVDRVGEPACLEPRKNGLWIWWSRVRGPKNPLLMESLERFLDTYSEFNSI